MNRKFFSPVPALRGRDNFYAKMALVNGILPPKHVAGLTKNPYLVVYWTSA
jgi:hypothetical protein